MFTLVLRRVPCDQPGSWRRTRRTRCPWHRYPRGPTSPCSQEIPAKAPVPDAGYRTTDKGPSASRHTTARGSLPRPVPAAPRPSPSTVSWRTPIPWGGAGRVDPSLTPHEAVFPKWNAAVVPTKPPPGCPGKQSLRSASRPKYPRRSLALRSTIGKACRH
jgi:hypothetical protein